MKQLLGYWHQFFKKAAKQPKAHRPLVMPGRQHAFNTGVGYDKLVSDGYKGNIIVYKCISQIAQALGSVPLFVEKDDGAQLPRHPLNVLIQEPRIGQSWAAFAQELVGHYLLSGNAYVELLSDENGAPQELIAWRPDRVEIVPGQYGFPKSYIYKVDTHKRERHVDPTTGDSNVFHLKNWHPKNDWYGLSPLEAAARAVDQHNAVAQHNLCLLKNGGRPSGALFFKPNEDGSLMSEEQREILREDLRMLHEGETNAGRMMIIEGNFEWREMGLSPKSMDFMEGKLLAAREIAQAFGVPSMLVGIPGDATFSNYREARYHLWEETVLPLLDRIIDGLNQWLGAYYAEENIRLSYDIEKIHALAPRREKKWARIEKAGFLTTNEKRAAFGYPPIDGGDAVV